MATAKKDAGAKDENPNETANAPDAEVSVAGITAPHVRRADAPFSTVQQILVSAAPPTQMVKVKETATGRVFAAWPVDARELVTHPDRGHEYASAEDEMTPAAAGASGNPDAVAPESTQSPVGVAPQASVTPPRTGAVDPLTATAQLSEKSTAELKDLAKRSGVEPNQSKEKLVEALQPHVSAGTVNLGGPAAHGLPPTVR